MVLLAKASGAAAAAGAPFFAGDDTGDAFFAGDDAAGDCPHDCGAVPVKTSFFDGEALPFKVFAAALRSPMMQQV